MVRCITGDSVDFTYNLTKTYDAAGSVQLVRAPHYTNATVTDTLTAQTWNGVTGGVLVFTVADTLRLSAPVNVSGKGFRGGTISNNPDGSCGAGYAAYYYPISQGVAAEKGEGIAKPLTNKTAGAEPWSAAAAVISITQAGPAAVTFLQAALAAIP